MSTVAMPARFRAACVAAAVLGVLTPTSSQTPAPKPLEPVARLHHVHYVVVDPAESMNALARAVGGVRVIVQGFGVGVRTATAYILFERGLDEGPEPSARPIATIYPLVLERLRQWRMHPQPDGLAQLQAATALAQQSVDHIGFSVADVRSARDSAVASGARVLSEREDAVLVDAGSGIRIELLTDTDREETYWCPMHPDVRSADPGTCPLCAMALIPIPPPRVGEYRLDVDPERDRRTGTIRAFSIAIREPGSDELVRDLQMVHEAALHLFVISRDLTYFEHVHPTRLPDGRYRLPHVLPAGEYMLIADFLPAGGTPQMVQRAVISGRGSGGGGSAGTPDLSRTQTVAGVTVTLDAGAVVGGKEAPMTFRVTDAATGAPITDLQPYLGAPAHMLVVKADLTDAIHSHPEEASTAGPTVSFHPLLPAPGDYRLWIQFKRGGRVLTFPFALRAEQ